MKYTGMQLMYMRRQAKRDEALCDHSQVIRITAQLG